MSSSNQEARQVTIDHIDPMCSLFLSSSLIGLHALILSPKPHTLGFRVHSLLVMLSHVVMSVIQAFPSL
jgi:hypothetical protein